MASVIPDGMKEFIFPETDDTQQVVERKGEEGIRTLVHAKFENPVSCGL